MHIKGEGHGVCLDSTAWVVTLSLYLASGIECPNANTEEMCRMINESREMRANENNFLSNFIRLCITGDIADVSELKRLPQNQI